MSVILVDKAGNHNQNSLNVVKFSKWLILKEIELYFAALIVNFYICVKMYIDFINVQKWDGKIVCTQNVNKPIKMTEVFLKPRPKR